MRDALASPRSNHSDSVEPEVDTISNFSELLPVLSVRMFIAAILSPSALAQRKSNMNKHPPPGSTHDPETSPEEEVREPPSDGKVIHEEFPRKGDIVDPGPAVGDK